MANPKITVDNFQAVDFTSWIPNEVLQYSSAAAGRQAWDAQNGKHARREKGIGRIADMPQDRTPFEELLPRPSLDAVEQAPEQPVKEAFSLDELRKVMYGLLKSFDGASKASIKQAYREVLTTIRPDGIAEATKIFTNWSTTSEVETAKICAEVRTRIDIENTEAKVNKVLLDYNPKLFNSVMSAAGVLVGAHAPALLMPLMGQGQRRVAFLTWSSWQMCVNDMRATEEWHTKMVRVCGIRIPLSVAVGHDCEMEIHGHYAELRDEVRLALSDMMMKGYAKADLLNLIGEKGKGAAKLADVPDRFLVALRDAAERAARFVSV